MHAAGEYRPEMLNDDPLLSVVNETNRILGKALDAGIADNIPSPAMLKKLREDVFVFSGFKTHAQLKEASSYLLTDDGKIKPFQDFRRDVWAVHTSYNSHYLEAEYIFATSSAEMASRWSDFEKDGDRYNLQYRTAGDDRVRDEHAAINLTTLPVDDPFWGSYFPPNGWRCRCVAVQVRKGKYEESNPEEAMAKGEKATTRINKKGENADAIFRFNPGKDKVIFPPHHPYRKVQDRVKRIIQSLDSNAQAWEQIDTEKGNVRVHAMHNLDERTENIVTATHLAKSHGYSIDLLPVHPDKKNADSYNRTLKINQEYKTNKVATKSAIDNELRDASKQADHIVININSDIDYNTLGRGIKGRVNQEKNIKSVTIIRNGKDKTYDRSDIMKKGFNL